MIKHTPGPWRSIRNEVHAGRFRIVSHVNAGELLGLLEAYGRERANARLIAASPEMAELLATFTMWARQVAARSDVPQGIRSAAAQLHDDGKRLHAKATGEAS